MNAIVCDRCGKVMTSLSYRSNDIGFVYIEDSSVSSYKTEPIHLCVNCLVSLRDWIKEYLRVSKDKELL